MEKPPLHVAIIWHMHQPYYKDPDTGEYILPWVRLHAIKDYYDMVSILEDFSSVHQTFNLAPSLLEQLEDYTSGNAKDIYFEISAKHPKDLSAKEKTFILENFFMLNWENMVKPFPRYWELLTKRGEVVRKNSLYETIRYFSNQDILDLQVWFNLSWFDPIHREKDNFLKEMVKKNRNFSQEEKEFILKKQIEIIKMVIPKYKEMEEKEIIEISISPFYHPILPLLCDTYSAREAMPATKLPQERFRHPEDAVTQIKMGQDYFQSLFKHKPIGHWPPEGSVSNELIPLLIEEAIQWIATDEGILSKSINHIFKRDNKGLCLEPEVLYKTYYMEYKGKTINIIFRDRLISDLIGFVYSRWEHRDAVSDLTDRLYQIREKLIEKTGSVEGFIVPIILDGENPWEHYKNDGRDFLRGLYSELENNPHLKPVTVKEHLQYTSTLNKNKIERLFAGSWIDHNFKIWIGHNEDNTAWEQLIQARRALSTHEKETKKGRYPLSPEEEKNLQEAWKMIYIAEGSDWFWWYGDEHASAKDREFDELFRKNLKKVYQLIKKNSPPSLDIPILTEDKEVVPTIIPTALIEPVIDGEVTNYYEWLPSGRLDREIFGESMHRVKGFISTIYYGFSLENLFIRVDYEKEFNFLISGQGLTLNVLSQEEIKLALMYNGTKYRLKLNEKKELKTFSIGSIIEIQIPFTDIKSKEGDEVKFFITIEKQGNVLERWPYRGYVSLNVPTKDFDRLYWFV